MHLKRLRLSVIKRVNSRYVLIAVLLLLVELTLLPWQPPARSMPLATDTPTYLGDNARDGFNRAETMLNMQTAPTLHKLWQYPTVQGIGAISVQPILVNSVLYWGSFNGYEHATDLNGNQLWQTFIGKSSGPCDPPNAGPSGTATVSTVTINGSSRSVVFVPGGDTAFYALDAATGAILWKTPLGTPPNQRIWAGAAVYNGYVYVGMSSWGDCPLVAGVFYQLNATTGAIVHSLQISPPGCVGGGIWSQPTIDETHGVLYVTTGNRATCTPAETLAYAILKVDPTTLTVLDSWTVPGNELVEDSDFGSTPTLFNATILGKQAHLVGTLNKNGYYYAFYQTNFHVGPKGYVWRTQISTSGPNCYSSISSSAYDGQYLYVEGTCTTINGQSCAGSVRALDPATGNVIWQYCAAGHAIGGVTVTSQLVIAEAGTQVLVLNSQTGALLWLFDDGATYANSWFWAAATVANGVIYTGNHDGILYALGIQGTSTTTLAATATPIPTTLTATATPTATTIPLPTATSSMP